MNRKEIEGSRKGTELGEDIFRNQLWTRCTGSTRRAPARKCGKGVWGKAGMGSLMGGRLQRERLVQADKIKPVQLWSEGMKQTHRYKRNLSAGEWRRPEKKSFIAPKADWQGNDGWENLRCLTVGLFLPSH